jgi:hypothetical protein
LVRSRCGLSIRPGTDSALVIANWRQLESQMPHVPLACSSIWTETWLNAYEDLVPHRFAELRDEQNRLRGLCLITEGVAQKDGPLPLRTLHIGTAGEPENDSVCVEYNSLLVDDEYHNQFASHLAAWFRSQRGLDQWNLDGFHESELEVWTDHTNSLDVRREATHWFDLSIPRASGIDVLSSYRSATRRKVKRSLEAYSNLTTEWAESIDHATDIFGEMVELHQSRWKALGKPGSYASGRFVRFHEEMLARLVPEQRLVLCRVRSNAGTVGCVQLFENNNRALLYQCGWAPSDSKSSPGVVVDHLAMEECLKRGFDAYDFLAYETQHKRLLSNASCNLVWARHRNPSWKFTALNAARGLKQALTKCSGTQDKNVTND